jgi:hypothetical protein
MIGRVIESAMAGFVDASGNPLAAGKLYSYQVGTTTPKSLFTDAGCTVAAANPVVLGANGTSQVYGLGSYKFVLETAAGVAFKTFDDLHFTPSVLDWVPVFTAGGSMTVTSTTIYLAKYFRHGDVVFVNMSGILTLGGVANSTVIFTLPINAITAAYNLSASADGIGGHAFTASATQGNILKTDNSNWTIGAARGFGVSGWYLAA